MESTEAFAESNNTKTTSAVDEALPFESVAHHGEMRFILRYRWSLRLKTVKRSLTLEISLTGRLTGVCEFFSGSHPQARGVRAYSAVSVFGKVIGDAKIFRNVKEGERISVETAG